MTTRSGDAALKVYFPAFFEGQNSLIELKRIELQIRLRGHANKNLVDIWEAEAIEEDGTWYLLMEFLPWSSLEKKIGQVPASKIHSLIKQLVGAVKFLESQGLVHRDIKPSNIVVSDDFESLKLLDLGVLRHIAHDEGNGTDGHQFVATAQYSPPEYLTRDEIPGADGFNAVNVYQVGAVLHDMITGIPLFAEQKATRNKFKLFQAVTEQRPRVVSDSVPPRLIALSLAALDKNPVIRTQSVRLEDFLADADSLEMLRRRVAQGAAVVTKSVLPSISAWRSKVQSWGREAAQLEAENLGAVAMKKLALQRGQRWELTFAAASAPVYIDLVLIDDGLAVHVLSSTDGDRGAPVFIIGSDGPNLPSTGIAGALAARYLYALDLALSR